MSARLVLVAAMLAAASGAAWAGEPPKSTIKVLDHPYQISSFYRSGERPAATWSTADRHAIAAYYRQSPPNRYGYSRRYLVRETEARPEPGGVPIWQFYRR